MSRRTGIDPLKWGLGYMALMLAIIFMRLLPLDTSPIIWPRPDMMMVITFAIAVRRPRHLPVLCVVIMFLLADFLFLRPPGLGALLVVLGSEALRARSEGLRAEVASREWLTVALVMIAVLFASRFMSIALFLPPPPLLADTATTLLSILVYPLVASALGFVLGVRQRAPGELDSRGQRL